MSQLAKRLNIARQNSLLWALLTTLLLPASSYADTLWVKSSAEANTFKIANIHILRVHDGGIFYESAGRENSKPFASIVKIALDDEPALTSAEDAYESKTWDKATDGYQLAIRATARPWVKDWCGIRLVEAANKSGRFDAFVTGYITLVSKDPALVKDIKPTLPDSKSPALALAAGAISKALTTRLNDAQKQVLLVLQLDIQRARDDFDAAGIVAEQLIKLDPASANNPATLRALAGLKLSKARTAIANKQYAQAIADIDGSRTLFTEPETQVEALYCLATAQDALAADKKDPTALKDAALTYMRIVANFKTVEGKPHVAEALLKTAAICEKLNDPKAALLLYEQTADEFKGQPDGDKARENADRLKSKQQ